jgi:hypothetical protein
MTCLTRVTLINPWQEDSKFALHQSCQTTTRFTTMADANSSGASVEMRCYSPGSGARLSATVAEFSDPVAKILNADGITAAHSHREGELQLFHLMVALVVAAVLAGGCGAGGDRAAERRTGRVRGASHGSLSFHFAIPGPPFQSVDRVFW